MRWMSSFFINKYGVSKLCHCHGKIPQFECQVYRKHFCKPLGSRAQNRAKSLICMSNEMTTIPSGALWTSRTNLSPLFYTYKQLAINHFQYLKQIQPFFSRISLHNLFDYSLWVVHQVRWFSLLFPLCQYMLTSVSCQTLIFSDIQLYSTSF